MGINKMGLLAKDVINISYLCTMKAPFLLFFLMLAFSCRQEEVPGSPLPPPPEPEFSVFVDTSPDHSSSHLYKITPSGDELVIRSLEREGIGLVIMVQFGGGCKSHDFRLLKQNTYSEGGTITSNWLLHHDDNGDLCKAWPVQYLFFDLRKMQTTNGAVLEPYKVEYWREVE